MDWGVQAFDKNGNLKFDAERLKHRLWDRFEVSAAGSRYYHTPLDHKPTVIAYGSNGGHPFVWEHITSGGQYTGLRAVSDGIAKDPTVFAVFARQ